MNGPRYAWFVRDTPGVAANFLRAEALPVKTAEAAQYFLPPRVLPRNLDRAFVGFRSTQAKEGFLERPRRDLRQLFAEPPAWVGGDAGVHIGQGFRLLLDCLDDVAAAPPVIYVHQLGGEGQVSVAAPIPQGTTPRPRVPDRCAHTTRVPS